MELMDAVRSRKSVRGYLPRPVEEEKLMAVLEAGRLAPSASNMQDWRFVVVRDQMTRARLSEAAMGQVYVAQAPVVITACGTSTRAMPNGIPTFAVDVSIAVDHMTLAAASLGLGTCWIGAFHQDKVKEILGIPKGITVVALLPLGYPADGGRATMVTPRKRMDEIVAYEKW